MVVRTPTVGRPRVVAGLPYLLLILLIAVHIIYSYSYASTLNEYVSDECWYVSSARNILVRIFGITPRYETDGLVGVSVELTDLGSRDRVLRELVALGGRVAKADYGTIPLIYVELPKTVDVGLVRNIPGVRYVVTGFMYPDSASITDYLNTEHPPLFKYLVATSITICGDRPLCWRLPSIAASATIIPLAYLAVRSVVGGVTGSYLGVIASLMLLLDNLFRVMSVVAMIDMTLAMLTTLALCTLVKSRVLASYVSLGLAAVAKYSGLFIAPVLLYSAISSGVVPAYAMAYITLIPLAMLLVSSLPLINHLGFSRWWYEAVENAVRWHLSVKTLSGPPTSAPWEWLVGANPFILHYTRVNGTWIADLVARGNSAIYLLAVTTTVLVLPVLDKLPDRGLTCKFTWSVFLMYVLVWFLGGRTQYSFYMVQLVPALYALLMINVYWLADVDNTKLLVRKWLRLLNLVLRWLTGNAKVRIELKIQHSPSG